MPAATKCCSRPKTMPAEPKNLTEPVFKLSKQTGAMLTCHGIVRNQRRFVMPLIGTYTLQKRTKVLEIMPRDGICCLAH